MYAVGTVPVPGLRPRMIKVAGSPHGGRHGAGDRGFGLRSRREDNQSACSWVEGVENLPTREKAVSLRHHRSESAINAASIAAKGGKLHEARSSRARGCLLATAGDVGG